MRQSRETRPDGTSHLPRILESPPEIRDTRPARRARPAADGGFRHTNSSAVRAFLIGVLIVLLATLAYLLSLSSKPSISGMSPAPGSSTSPGMVIVEANVGAAKPIQKVTLTIDGVVETPAVLTVSERSWIIRYQGMLSHGTHQATITVRDTDGAEQHQTWSFDAAGPRVSPVIQFTNPPANATIAQGLIRINAETYSDADISSAVLTINGQEVPVTTTITNATRQSTATAPGKAVQLNLTSEKALPAGSYVAHLIAIDTQGDESEADLRFTVTADPGSATTRYFSSTKNYVTDPFRSFWEAHEGRILFGDPVSSQLIDPSGKTVQYFQRARFELGQNGEVVLGLIGDEALESSQERVEKPNGFAGLYFGVTGHTLAGKFEVFWSEHGGVAIFGYPISEVLDQNGTKVQYFERARFELATGSNDSTIVQLTPLGEQIWNATNAATNPTS